MSEAEENQNAEHNKWNVNREIKEVIKRTEIYTCEMQSDWNAKDGIAKL